MTRDPMNPAPPQATYATMPPLEVAQQIEEQRRAQEARELARIEFELECE